MLIAIATETTRYTINTHQLRLTYITAFDDRMEKQATVVLDFFPKKVYKTRFVANSSQIIVIYQGLEENRIMQYVALLDDKGRLAGSFKATAR